MKECGRAVFKGLPAFVLLATTGCGGQGAGSLNQPLKSFRQEITSPVRELAVRPGKMFHLPVLVKNTGEESWVSRGTRPVMLSYRWVMRDGLQSSSEERTGLGDIVRPGAAVSREIRVIPPPHDGEFTLTISMVQEGMAWFNTMGGTALEIPARAVSQPILPVDSPLTAFSQEITSPLVRLALKALDTVDVPVSIRNASSMPWSSAGRHPITVSSKWFEGQTMLPGEGPRTFLPGTLNPGEMTNLSVKVAAPASGQNLTLKVTLVQEGVAWFLSAGGSPLTLPVELLQ